MGKLTKSRVDRLQAQKREFIVWDDDLPGYGLRVYPSGAKTYFVQYRVGRRTRRMKLGSAAVLTAEQARTAAKKALGVVANGGDPTSERRAIRDDITVSALCDLYLAEGCATKKPSTIATDSGRITRHIKPLLGSLTVRAVQSADIEKFLKDVATGKTATNLKTKPRGRARVTGGKGTASRTVGLLGAIFTYAQGRRLRADNPVHGVRRYQDRRMQRFLSADELTRLGIALDTACQKGANRSALAAIAVLVLTGCRKAEILKLRWEDVHWDARCLVLPESKTGHKVVPLGQIALHKLAEIRTENATGFVFRGEGKEHFKGLQRVWERVRKLARLDGVRLHDLRHTYISSGVNNGISLTTMGEIAGHRDTQTTRRYAHLVPGATHLAADTVSKLLAVSLLNERREPPSASGADS